MQRQPRADEGYFKKIDYIFYNEAAIREAVLETKNNAARSEITNASSLSDPTAAEAIRKLTPVTAIVLNEKILRYPEHWLEVVENTKSWCRERGETFYIILRDRYNEIETKKTCADLNISADFYYRTLEKIRIHAALVAAYLHLIEPGG